MGSYLVVAHQTADSPTLRTAIAEVREEDPEAHFTLLVPATHVDHLLTWTRGESRAVARESGERARARLEDDDVPVDEVLVGDENPIYAVTDVIAARDFDRVIVSTLPVGVSRWIHMDVVSRLERTIDLPVTHIVAADA